MSNITDEEKSIRKALKCLYLEVDSSIADDINKRFNAFAALQNKVSDPATEQSTVNWGKVGDKDKFIDEVRGNESDISEILFGDKVFDLTGLDEKEKDKFIRDISTSASKIFLKLFLGLKLDNYIETMVINDFDKKEYVLTFQTLEHFKKRFKEFQKESGVSAEEVLSKYVWNGFSHSRSEEDCLKAMREYASIVNRKDNVGVNEAIEFAEWIVNKEYMRYRENGVHRWFKIGKIESCTTTELFEIFHKSQPQKEEVNECYFVPKKDTTSATICMNCGKEKSLHTIGEGIKATKVIYNP